ncbi:hypothetical protein A1OQ_16405 [Enterovibrio norvegicus FF-162]|uniref:hypothetical protein n=1 Tax=Enterovibrio norvegicus TaxID=188144 RepID=UPI00036BD997|nr:hypothetical protein [Enterovibrio norvegicus]OEE86678.1 hypothetical protein A1OQ_16405 [Enterovibrio norvegicus FF-162]
MLPKEQSKVGLNISPPEVVESALPQTLELTEKYCQLDSNSEACKEDLMIAASTMNVIIMGAILVMLVFPRLIKQNTSGMNCLIGLTIIAISIMQTMFIGTHGLMDYINQYPYVLAVMLLGVSLGVNLVSHYLTEQFTKPQREAPPVVYSKPVILDTNIDTEIKRLKCSLKEAINLSETLADLQIATEAQCNSYKKELEHIKASAENALHENNTQTKQADKLEKQVDAKETE